MRIVSSQGLPTTTQLYVTLTLLLSFVRKGMSLVCYECESKKRPECGPYFRDYEAIKECADNEVTCALQKQDYIKDRQIAGYNRACYSPDQLPGLDHSDGCRYFTTDDGYTAYYCFCSKDLCNRSVTQLPNPTYVYTLALVALGGILLRLVKLGM